MSGTSVPDLVPGCDSSSSPVPIDISSLSSSSSHISTNGHQTEHEIPTQNGHAQDSRSTNGYFLQTPPSNYCQNGTTNNSEYDGVNARSQNLINSFMLSQSANSNGTCPIADSAITTTPCSLNFCAHCSRASPNHLNGRVTEGLTVQSYRPISNHQALSTSQANGDGSILSNGVSENGELRKTANNHPGSSHSSRKPSQCSCDWVDLNVGGRIFKTTRLTLSKVPGSFLDCLCNNQNLLSSHVDQNGLYKLNYRSSIYLLSHTNKLLSIPKLTRKFCYARLVSIFQTFQREFQVMMRFRKRLKTSAVNFPSSQTIYIY